MTQEKVSVEVSTPAKVDIPDGPYVENYPSGALRIKGTYRKGLKEGQWTAYYESGQKWSEDHYVNDTKPGPTKSFYINGVVRYTGYYNQDKEKGLWYFFNKEGKEEKVVNFDEKK